MEGWGGALPISEWQTRKSEQEVTEQDGGAATQTKERYCGYSL